MESEGVSSINRGAFSRSVTLTLSCCHSWSASFPVRSFSEESPVSAEIKRVMSCIEDISNEKNATGICFMTAIFRAIERVRAVLPIPGRAAIIIRSLGCQPEVSLSIFSKPVLIPLKPSLFEISSIFFFASKTRFCADSDDFLIFP